MGTNEETIDIDALERQLLSNGEDETILYNASFQELEDKFLKYQITKWVLYSLILILFWGFGLLMLLYLPVRIYICKKEFRSKKLYLTPDAIIYKKYRPVFLPCFGDLKIEKYIILPSIADVIIEQGYLQSYFGIFSIRIENRGVRKPTKIQGLVFPNDFQKVVLTRLSIMKNKALNKQASSSLAAAPGNLILQKLDEVESSLKKVHSLMETKGK